jgi:hypothetical protein
MVTAKKFSLFELVTPSREARYAPTSLGLSGTLLQNPICRALFLELIETFSPVRAAATIVLLESHHLFFSALVFGLGDRATLSWSKQGWGQNLGFASEI